MLRHATTNRIRRGCRLFRTSGFLLKAAVAEKKVVLRAVDIQTPAGPGKPTGGVRFHDEPWEGDAGEHLCGRGRRHGGPSPMRRTRGTCTPSVNSEGSSSMKKSLVSRGH